MYKNKKATIFVCILSVYACLLQSGIVFALCNVGPELNFSVGYRNDALQRTNLLYVQPSVVSQNDRITIKNINLFQIGFNGRLMARPDDEECHPLLSFRNFFLSGYAYWSGGGNGARLREQITTSTVGLEQQLGRASLKKARMCDYQIGLGYLFEKNCWDVSLSVGYAYDRQKVWTKFGQIAFPAQAPFVAAPLYGPGYKTTTIWKGPWGGTELFYNWCSWRFSLGYELHGAHYKANHYLPALATAQQQGMATTTKSSHAFGNILLLNARYFFCENGECGLGFTYRHWHARKGNVTSAYFSTNGYPSTTTATATGRWTSYALSFDIGYAF